MAIDWFTILAQALNFLVLVWLMKRFLYKSILGAIEAREKRIESELANAAEIKADAEKEGNEYKKKSSEFDQQRASLLSKATQEAEAERDRLFEEARKSAAALSAKRSETIRGEERNLRQALTRRTQEEVFAIARKTLGDLAGTSLEERVIQVFLGRLGALSVEEKGRLASALKDSSSPAMVRTAFDLTPEQRDSTEDAIKEALLPGIQVKFETAPDLISGIELAGQGRKVSWNIAEYLKSLQGGIEELLKEKGPSEAKAEKVTKEREKKSKPETQMRGAERGA